MEMIEIRHSIEGHLREKGFNWHGGGTDLETGVMDITFDHEGFNYEITLRTVGPMSVTEMEASDGTE